jgi:hypothetical protein
MKVRRVPSGLQLPLRGGSPVGSLLAKATVRTPGPWAVALWERAAVEARARSRVKLGACDIRWFECIGTLRAGPEPGA